MESHRKPISRKLCDLVALVDSFSASSSFPYASQYSYGASPKYCIDLTSYLFFFPISPALSSSSSDSSFCSMSREDTFSSSLLSLCLSPLLLLRSFSHVDNRLHNSPQPYHFKFVFPVYPIYHIKITARRFSSSWSWCYWMVTWERSRLLHSHPSTSWKEAHQPKASLCSPLRHCEMGTPPGRSTNHNYMWQFYHYRCNKKYSQGGTINALLLLYLPSRCRRRTTR